MPRRIAKNFTYDAIATVSPIYHSERRSQAMFSKPLCMKFRVLQALQETAEDDPGQLFLFAIQNTPLNIVPGFREKLKSVI